MSFDLENHKNETILTCFEYLTVNAFKCFESKQTQTKMQQCLFAMDTQAHVKVLELAAGIVPNSTNLPYYRVVIAQQQALDVLIWLLTQWRVSKDKYSYNHFINSARLENESTLLHWLFIIFCPT